jgi:glycosyltransferase involved in cell wall biosynthesis
MKKPLVSVIVPTKNSSETLTSCLKSIKNQSFKNYEIILVDNNSTDKTKEIASKFTKKIFNKGPERSTQRNFGAKKASGKFLLFIDSDMTLDKNAIKEAVEIFSKNSKVGGLIIPERSIGKSFWGKCKALEKGFYEGVEWIEAGRIFKKSIFEKVGGFDTTLISGEDWDLSHRIAGVSEVSRIKSFVTHNEGDVSLMDVVKKKYYYSIHISKYITKSSGNLNIMVADRYKLFFSKPKKLFKNPLLGVGLLFIKTCEFGGGFIGYMVGRIKK